jgi:hypothetical protein
VRRRTARILCGTSRDSAGVLAGVGLLAIPGLGCCRAYHGGAGPAGRERDSWRDSRSPDWYGGYLNMRPRDTNVTSKRVVFCSRSILTIPSGRHTKGILGRTGAHDITGEATSDYAKSDKPLPRAVAGGAI